MSFGKYGRFGFFMIFPESHPSTLAHQKKQIQQILPILCQSWALKSPHTTGERVPTFHHWSHRNQLKSSQIGINRSLHNGKWIGIRSDIKQTHRQFVWFHSQEGSVSLPVHICKPLTIFKDHATLGSTMHLGHVSGVCEFRTFRTSISCNTVNFLTILEGCHLKSLQHHLVSRPSPPWHSASVRGSERRRDPSDSVDDVRITK